MAAPVSIRRFGPHDAGTRSDDFVAVGLRLQLADPRRVAATVDSVRAKLRGDFPFFAYGDAAFFVAERDGRAVGRVAAIVNWHARDRNGAQLGYLGMYEAEDDDVARALLDAALEWLAHRPEAVASAVGPVDFSTWYSYRFSVPEPDEGRHPTFWLEPVTSDHCVRQWQRYGFAPHYRYLSMRSDDLEAVRRDMGAIETIEQEGYRLRTIDLSRMRRELGVLHDLSTRSFADARLYTPVGFREFAASYAGLERIVTPGLVLFVQEPGGEDVGFAFNVPNYVEAARRMRGSSSLVARLRFLRGRGRPAEMMLKTVGVIPERQDSRVGLALMQASYRAGIEHGFRHFLHALMSSGNPAILNIVGRSNPRQIRRYAVLRHPVGSQAAEAGPTAEAAVEQTAET